jgi:hypothetical protein
MMCLPSLLQIVRLKVVNACRIACLYDTGLTCFFRFFFKKNFYKIIAAGENSDLADRSMSMIETVVPMVLFHLLKDVIYYQVKTCKHASITSISNSFMPYYRICSYVCTPFPFLGALKLWL